MSQTYDPSTAAARWSLLGELFEEALAHPPHERATFVARACMDNHELRAELERLLAHERGVPAEFLRPSDDPRAPAASDGADPLIGTTVAGYDIRRVVASGGMGTVYEATQQRPRRTVALKLLRSGIFAHSALRRFEYESQTLARLQHPNIAQIYESGACTHPAAPGVRVPYFAMEYVADARTITDFARRSGLGTRQRLELFTQVCDAVHHGHQKGIIHRDLKPGNLLVDAAGRVKVIDFGVARSTDADLTITTAATDVGQVIGTLQYMSPEQCRGDAGAIDVRTDVYSLGVVLYELLCDKLPYDVSRASLAEAARVISDEVPGRLSAVDRALRGDVETIVAKALAKNRAQRYQSAADLLADLRRFLGNIPIAARQPTTWYRFSRFARRNRALVATGVVAIAAVAAAISTLVAAYIWADHARRDAERLASRALLSAAEMSIVTGDIRAARRHLDSIPAALRDWEWGHLQGLSDSSIAKFDPQRPASGALPAFHPDGRRTALAMPSGEVRLYDLRSGLVLATFLGLADGAFKPSFTADGTLAAAGDATGRICIWNAETARPVRCTERFGELLSRVLIHPDGTHVAATDHQSECCVWRVSDGTQVWCDSITPSSYLVYSVDGAHLAWESQDGTVHFWDASSGRSALRPLPHGEFVNAVAFHPDNSSLATASGGDRVRIWDLATGTCLLDHQSGEGNIDVLHFSPDGSQLAAGHRNGTVQILDPVDDRPPVVLRGLGEPGQALRFSLDGRSIWAASYEEAREFSVADHDPVMVLAAEQSNVRSVVFSPDGRRIVSGGDDTLVRIWDADTGLEVASLAGHDASIVAVAITAAGDRIASASEDQTVRLWNARTGELVRVLGGHTGIVAAVAFSHKGTLVASGSWDRTVRLWDLTANSEPLVLEGHRNRVKGVAFDSDGRRLVSADFDGTLRFWNAHTGVAIGAPRSTGAKGLQSVAYSADGRSVAAGGLDGGVVVGLAASDQPPHLMRQPAVSSVAYSPDGTRLVTGSSDALVRLWDVERGETLLVLRGHALSVNSVAFSADGIRIASASADRTIRIWDSIPFHMRYARRRAVLDAAPEAGRLVDALWDENEDWNCVADRLLSDTSNAEAHTQAALNELLRRAQRN